MHRRRLAAVLGAWALLLVSLPMARASDSAAQPGDVGADRILAGTAWRLVTIQSMDDQVYTPQERDRYTLVLRTDGSAALRADCNRGSGRWDSNAPGQIRFGPIASTRALCASPSLSQKYLAQFEGVRSYIVERGRLYLATMADGAIIEFESTGALLPGALLLGQIVPETDPEGVQARIVDALQARYALEKGIGVTEAEVDAYLTAMREGSAAAGLTAEQDLTPREASEVAAVQRDMVRALILRWKTNAALYEQYGGRLVAQQFGPKPLDAWREFLREQQAAGAFHVVDRATERSFWRDFTDGSIHDFLPSGSAAERDAFKTPPWAQ